MTTSVWDSEALLSVITCALESRSDWQIVNEHTGDTLCIEPDQPTPGMVTLTLWEKHV